ncbi:biotin operon repressor biotin--[acetyl-CoA-carboxylase] synthetase [Liquorilactobacillus aquaticus DSM 21051]|uniref:Bifunctional ligase/repressor BirA n=1 Tax=Liquorilactobacillus aquaticus DSM 21051 TaxID=1423725 RepID=A0A0R2CWI4_9LACO|nr:biotin--[acetyl-CoA-carboxylase] ligase [Liquorilactobacillus aquaticus]KRM96205.1 biotin operon repressor biotin--[acetyl-CoA-carboxylase] synthetase [Liquorilactobacillus aquaticus DSM 21051]
METNQLVLQELSLSDQPISGEQLAQKLSISRTAIWKAIKTLKQKGYQIESKPHVGYKYKDNGILNEFVIRRYLPANTNRILDFEMHDKISSTNTRAKEISIETDENLPLVIISDQQTAGYGRYGRAFTSPNTGIYMSLLLKNSSTLLNPGLLTTATATAVSRAIEKKLHTTPSIKWVNDILIDKKKIVGILTEGIADIESRYIKQIVIGIGINYSTDVSDMPSEIQQRAGSLHSFAKTYSVSRNEFIAAVLQEFFLLYPHYETGAFLDEYRAHSAVLNKKVTITQGHNQFSGYVEQINRQGEIVLDDGTTLSSGEVTKIRLE